MMRPGARATAEVMAQVLRTTSSMAFSNGLNPAQWAAMRYFAQAAPGARSVVAFARYHGTTKGTASQTIAALLKKGLLDRRRSDRDRRTVSLMLTDLGRSMLNNDPLNELAYAVSLLDEEDHRIMAGCLDDLLRVLLERRAMRLAARGVNDEEEDGEEAESGAAD